MIFAIIYSFPQNSYFLAAVGPFQKNEPLEMPYFNSSSKKVFEQISDPLMLRNQDIVRIDSGAYFYNSIDLKNHIVYDENFYLSKNIESINDSMMKSAILGLRFSLKDIEFPNEFPIENNMINLIVKNEN